ncbi:hypothetical protein MJ_1049 [Methanocaldococcus jannaschii DSM 2661]|uniref:Uncharacterized protein MJ1049 n=1 Tax=Methanocaldococcus jannaschii (strain ATCC 43067 / DSM 2661 / JAL-1 / JCM 10045 / NBRC 100440) TaxID=243232 RepID=Y1049_METJA|nr:hypothetical protein [Methanocaldococcus jannaschii]Q58449.1 RecName: Full=Uncharacterized protein MJ1049 [Methanocaldococcus jannaschii DSM 2661]AAB99059.1 hypothetical protein MJ_1049 [Methanocaldococcus jannaschii DSM 2661]
MVIKKIIKKIRGNKDLPKPIEVPDEEYIVIGEEKPAYILEEESETESEVLGLEHKEKEEVKEVEEVVRVEKILPKLYVVRIKHPLDFENIKDKIPEYDVVIVNFEEVPFESILKELNEFRDYMSILNFKLGFVAENVLLAYRDDVILDKYVSNITDDAENV